MVFEKDIAGLKGFVAKARKKELSGADVILFSLLPLFILAPVINLGFGIEGWDYKFRYIWFLFFSFL